MQHSDIKLVSSILAEQAEFQTEPRQFFNSLLSQAGLPRNWIRAIQGQWSGNINIDANSLVQWALKKGINPERQQYKTLGCICEVLLDYLGKEQSQELAIRIIHYRLYLDQELLLRLAQRYSIPQPVEDSDPKNTGPDFIWFGSKDELELQRFLRSTSSLVDLGLATQRGKSICRVEVPSSSGFSYGTGFLIAENLVLTNYHVIIDAISGSHGNNIQNIILRFSYISGDKEKPNTGQTFGLNLSKPIERHSPVELLDYVLLRVEDRILDAIDIATTPYEVIDPPVGAGLHILQHPKGETMKLGSSENAIVGIHKNFNRIQYVTRTSLGSSGAPCFNDAWKVVALHRAERRTSFGYIREGILFSSIYREIQDFIT